MTIEKRGNSYRITQMRNGRRYHLTLKYKPTKKEAEELIYDVMCNFSDFALEGSFKDYAHKYIAYKQNVLSPSTIRGYNTILRNLSEDFASVQLRLIRNDDIQKEVNNKASDHSPKTVRNMFGFISAVIKFNRPKFVSDVTLPQLKTYDYYIPTSEEVRKVLDVCKGTKFEVPIRLGTYGLRRSEICALTISDLSEDCCIRINKACVPSDTKFVIKDNTKTQKSTRSIYIDDELADLIRKQGYVCQLNPNSILKALHRFQNQAGVPKFRLHDMRHYFVTELTKSAMASDIELSEKDILYLGGYSSPHVMKRVYAHARAEQDAEIRKQAQQILSKKLAPI